MMMGSIAMQKKGLMRTNLMQARQHFELALKLAQAQELSDPKMAALIPQIKQALTALTDLFRGPMGFGPTGMPFPAGGMGGPPASMIDAFEAMMAEAAQGPDDFFDDDDNDDWVPAPAPAPRPRGKNKKKKR